jgi:hypothetical protein
MPEERGTALIIPSHIDPETAELIKSCYSDKPNPKALRVLGGVLEERPELYMTVLDLAGAVRTTLTDKIVRQPAARLGLDANLKHMQQEMGYDQAPMVERLLIDNVLNCWLRYQWVENALAGYMGQQEVRFVELEFWEKRLSATQRRYLRALETLARIRRLELPPVQVNINTENGQQVNVAGNMFTKGGKA